MSLDGIHSAGALSIVAVTASGSGPVGGFSPASLGFACTLDDGYATNSLGRSDPR